MAINAFFDALDAHNSQVLSVETSVRDFLWTNRRTQTTIAIIVCCAGSILIFALEAMIFDLSSKDAKQVATFVALVPLAPLALMYERVYHKMRTLFYTQLAALLDATYVPESAVPTDGQLFSMGSNKKVANVLRGKEGGPISWVGEYSYESSEGKNKHQYLYTVAALDFPKALPRLICIPYPWADGFFSPWQPKSFAPLRVATEFNTKFHVYGPTDGEMEVFQILEPNIMAELIDHFSHCGFECVGQTLYIFTGSGMRNNRESMTELLLLIKRFRELLVPELQPFLR